MTAEIDSGTLH